MILLKVLALLRKSSGLTLVKPRENFAKVCIIMLIIVILLLIEKSNFKAGNKYVYFPIQFILEVYIKHLAILRWLRIVLRNGSWFFSQLQCHS